eukprot:TRINITY_DN19343_c0_g3_i1.p1 TRINITY_DN19343_c0_g3~~TRINITY_DN19343_c0_g3_i1.p1  ORF type:complete len:277 (-),score=11.90 TRINITY_DN19343_c0_g3_i1:426-1202(-)
MQLKLKLRLIKYVSTITYIFVLLQKNYVLGNEECKKHPKCVFVAAIGLSGSTTLMDVINQHPAVHLRGENNGLFNKLLDTINDIKWKSNYEEILRKQDWDRMQRSSVISRAEGYKGAASFFKQLYAHGQDATKVVGFKEIRYRSEAQLDFVRDLCENSKFVFQYAKDIDSLKRREWFANMKGAEWMIKQKTKLLFDYHQKYPNDTFLSTIDDFKDPTFPQRLYDFLGVSLEGVNIDVGRVHRITHPKLYHSRKSKINQ